MDKSNRKIVVVRHGERVDFTFGYDWIKRCVDENGVYTKRNLNMPDTLRKRENYPDSYFNDGPLTEIGKFQAHLLGRGLAAEGVLPKDNFIVFSSPLMRCIQTATSILEGMGLKHPPLIKVEPFICEWAGCYHEQIPQLLTKEELIEFGFKIDPDHKIFKSIEEVLPKETVEDYYQRSYSLVQHILAENPGKDLLIVGHRGTIDTATRQLFGKDPLNLEQATKALESLPYCAISIAEEDSDGIWSLQNVSESLTLKHDSSKYCDVYSALN